MNIREVGIREMDIREAGEDDIPAVVAMLADDHLGRTREHPGDPAYGRAFAAMRAQAGNHLFLGTLPEADAVACAQLILQPGLSRTGTLRATIEGVRVASAWRRRRLGEAMIRHCIAFARAEGAGLVQLTSDVSRTDAHRFYERLGFTVTSIGMKLMLG